MIHDSGVQAALCLTGAGAIVAGACGFYLRGAWDKYQARKWWKQERRQRNERAINRMRAEEALSHFQNPDAVRKMASSMAHDLMKPFPTLKNEGSMIIYEREQG